MEQITFKKSKENLSVVTIDNVDYVKSYNTLVAKIDWSNSNLILIPWNIAGRSSSPTTSRHINFVAREYKLSITKS